MHYFFLEHQHQTRYTTSRNLCCAVPVPGICQRRYHVVVRDSYLWPDVFVGACQK